MKHPELIENLGRIHKKDRGHDYGKFQCPFCPNTFVTQISKVTNEHTKSCGCRKKKNFVQKIERTLKAKLTRKQLISLYMEHRDTDANKAYLCKRYGIRPAHFSVAIRLADETYTKPIRRVVDSKPNAVATVCSDPELLSRSLEQRPQQTIIVNGDLHMTITKDANELPFWNTDAGFEATKKYFKEFHQMPPEELDLKLYWEQRGAGLMN